MTVMRSVLSIVALTTAILATPACAADTPQGGVNSAHTATLPITQTITQMGVDTHSATPPLTYDEQMRAMAVMHEQMFSSQTPAERNALMTSRMRHMQDGMNMMGDMGRHGHMGGGAMMGNSDDTAAQQALMEQRMDMMQAMLQLMMDHMQSAPSAK